MLRLAALLLLGACMACADELHCCSAGDRAVVQKQWKALWQDTESSKYKIGVGRLMLLKLVELNDDAKATFSNVGIDDPKGGAFSAHCMRVMNGLDMVINLLSNPRALNSALNHLADQHQVRTGVTKAHFKSMGTILDGGLSKVIDNYNPMAWKACFRGILTKMASKLPA